MSGPFGHTWLRRLAEDLDLSERRSPGPGAQGQPKGSPRAAQGGRSAFRSRFQPWSSPDPAHVQHVLTSKSRILHVLIMFFFQNDTWSMTNKQDMYIIYIICSMYKVPFLVPFFVSLFCAFDFWGHGHPGTPGSDWSLGGRARHRHGGDRHRDQGAFGLAEVSRRLSSDMLCQQICVTHRFLWRHRSYLW